MRLWPLSPENADFPHCSYTHTHTHTHTHTGLYTHTRTHTHHTQAILFSTPECLIQNCPPNHLMNDKIKGQRLKQKQEPGAVLSPGTCFQALGHPQSLQYGQHPIHPELCGFYQGGMGAVYIVQERSTDIFQDPEFWLFKNDLTMISLRIMTPLGERGGLCIRFWFGKSKIQKLWWLHNIVNVIDATEMYAALSTLQRAILCFICFTTIKNCLKNLQNWIFKKLLFHNSTVSLNH